MPQLLPVALRLSVFVVVAHVWAAVCLGEDTTVDRRPNRIQGFVTRSGNVLLENGKPFRFLSWNVPDLHIVQDPSWKQRALKPGGRMPDFWHPVTAFEQEDAVLAVAQMGGTVIRAYTLSIEAGRNNSHGPSHYTGPRAPLNEALMRDYDRMIALCGAHGIRLILPFIDEWDWLGGRKEFTRLSGGGDFYTTRAVIDDFKALIEQVVNRVNTVTGIPYHDDPTILAWETGNELQHVPAAWTSEIAAWIKHLAPRQLVADGAGGAEISLDNPDIDLVTGHYYDNAGKDYVARALRDLERLGAKRPFYIGEFGCTDPSMEIATMETALRSRITGVLFWSLRFHAEDGGFYWHNEGGRNSAYHWPGFASNQRSEEIRVLKRMAELAWSLRGVAAVPIERPRTPSLLFDERFDGLAWRGSAGATHYEIQRSTLDGQWTTVADALSDADEPFRPWRDPAAPAGSAFDYRIRAVNAAGASEWSVPVRVTWR